MDRCRLPCATPQYPTTISDKEPCRRRGPCPTPKTIPRRVARPAELQRIDFVETPGQPGRVARSLLQKICTVTRISRDLFADEGIACQQVQRSGRAIFQ